jgi:hypothetical protein
MRSRRIITGRIRGDSLLKALDSKSNSVFAFNVDKTDEYCCPVCISKVILKKGAVKIAHFAHSTDSDCPNKKNESLEHLNMKMNLCLQIKKLKVWTEAGYLNFLNYEDDMEVPLVKDRRADIVVTHPILKNKTIIECQVSPITYEEICQRTADYYREGHRIVWVFHISRLKRDSFYGKYDPSRIPDEIIKVYKNKFPPIFFMDDKGNLRKVEFMWKYNTETMAFLNFSHANLYEILGM